MSLDFVSVVSASPSVKSSLLLESVSSLPLPEVSLLEDMLENERRIKRGGVVCVLTQSAPQLCCLGPEQLQNFNSPILFKGGDNKGTQF